MEYSNADIIRMQRDAENRVRQMHMRAQKVAARKSPNDGNRISPPPRSISYNSASAIPSAKAERENEKSIPVQEQSESSKIAETTGDKSDNPECIIPAETGVEKEDDRTSQLTLFEGLNISSDTLIILALLFILSKEEKYNHLIIALCCILF